MHRIIIGLGIGGCVTFSLFILMAYLIKADVRPPLKEDAISIHEPDDDINLLIRRLPRKPEPPKNPPPPQTQRIAKAERPKIQSMNLNLGNSIH